jgi:Ser/Thr protein kinase RdoA (MazF antagonist)
MTIITSTYDFQAVVAEWFGVAPDEVRMISDGVNKNLRVVREEVDVFARFAPVSLHSRTRMEGKVALLTALRRLDVPCCELFEIDGSPIVGPLKVQDIEYNVLLNRTIPGEVLKLNRKNATAFGRSLALLHRATVNTGITTLAQRANAKDFSNIWPVFRDLVELFDCLSDNSKVRHGVCHGDAWWGNAIGAEGKAVIFDFEFAGIGQVAYDISTFIWNLRAQEHPSEDLIFRNFVDAYRNEHDVIFTSKELNLNFLLKEINNIRFLGENIRISKELKLATAVFARETLEFVLGDGISKFNWN